MINVLFLCTHNSARSVVAEVLLNTLAKGKFTGFSAGSSPKTAVNPIARKIAEEMRYDTKKLYSKSWDEFAKPNAPKMHIVITVCDSAAKEMCLFGQVTLCKFIGDLKIPQLQVVIRLKNVKHLMN